MKSPTTQPLILPSADKTPVTPEQLKELGRTRIMRPGDVVTMRGANEPRMCVNTVVRIEADDTDSPNNKQILGYEAECQWFDRNLKINKEIFNTDQLEIVAKAGEDVPDPEPLPGQNPNDPNNQNPSPNDKNPENPKKNNPNASDNQGAS